MRGDGVGRRAIGRRVAECRVQDGMTARVTEQMGLMMGLMRHSRCSVPRHSSPAPPDPILTPTPTATATAPVAPSTKQTRANQHPRRRLVLDPRWSATCVCCVFAAAAVAVAVNVSSPALRVPCAALS